MDVGTKIDNYEIIEHIGRGGMADVWSARDTTLGRLVAIKTIARNLASEADPVTMFQQEARTIAGLDHPNILPVFGFGEIKGMFYIAMRFVAGGSLEDELHRSALTYREVVSTGKAVASALDFAHKQSIIHLDLKPPNILLDSQGLPYLADFGLATRLDPSGHAQNPGSGTLLYMAPEQLTSDTLDHRADIYSFGLVLFHMLTGKLPFEAVTPLALKQLQFHEDLPHPADLNPDLPDELGDILRKCTAVNPEERHNTTIELMDAVEAALGSSVSLPEGEITGSSVVAGQSTAFVDLVSMFDPEQVQINEARDIYERARLAWDNGNGRFLLSVTHFMVMSDYFIEAKKHKLSYDEAGAQMLLRGALEYDYHVEQWWSVLNTDSRRWVCMHTVRSESPSARIRAFKRLETLPDDDPPVIPRQVAQALSIENNTESMLVALDVLAFRSKIMGETGYDVKTRYRNRVLGTIAHEGIERIAPDDWKNVTYSQEIDTLVADLALREDEPEIRAKAARTIGKMRSSRAVKHVAEGRKRGEKHTLQALAYILDEVPTLPKNIPFMPRLAAWLMNTGRRLSENPMGIVYAFMFALIGGWLGMGQHIYRLLGQTIAGTAFLESDLWQNTMAGGLFVGFLVAVLAVVSITLPRRLHGFWPLWTRVLWSAIAGYYLAQTVWWTYAWMYLNLGDVPRFIYMLTGAVTAIGLVIPAVLRLRGWSSFLITSLFSFVALCMGTLNW
ncbi:MAG: serine/threonine-protein kinase, partial [Chloroflexota bacterium]